MRPSRPKVKAEAATMRKARFNTSGIYVGTMRLRLIPVTIKPMTMIVNMVAMVLPRPFSPESSEASERYETADRLYPMPHAPKARMPAMIPSVKFSLMSTAICGETATPITQRISPAKIYGVRRYPKTGWRSEKEPMAT